MYNWAFKSQYDVNEIHAAGWLSTHVHVPDFVGTGRKLVKCWPPNQSRLKVDRLLQALKSPKEKYAETSAQSIRYSKFYLDFL